MYNAHAGRRRVRRAIIPLSGYRLGWDAGDTTDLINTLTTDFKPLIQAGAASIAGGQFVQSTPQGTTILGQGSNFAALGQGTGAFSLTTLALLGFGGLVVVLVVTRR